MLGTILLQAGGGMATQQIVVMVLIIVVFYFFMIRPQMKKQKDQKKYVEELKKGDRIVTTAGIHGRIVDLNETTFLVEVDNGRIRFDKAAISLDASKALNAPAKEKEAKA
ncbi:preprotein translocase subunit YajC [Mucilaginibacter aquatilis]|uniref:Sec translocon accessory complex subunit YajC n=1 Tax=Mucilaginibacter aquatilis TaxID=1517760 RepID=A0A6I4IBG4_9SPHI|nr:preprotein translocase subunit YajC [Mucilaginibacter aquatilis]MVN92317.1 preprotein translocase subunit YajC [Mucilaginibacter aquatilis]